MAHPPELPLPLVRAAIAAALAEDLGRAGDVTAAAVLAPDARAEAAMAAREAGVIAGQALAAEAFAAVGDVIYTPLVPDGTEVAPGAEIARIAGRARPLMAGERVALNFLCHLSGIASETARFVAAVRGTGARIACTRKTTPGLRAFEKYAVRAGGGINHRFGLDDAILIKDNHIAVAGGVAPALEAAFAAAGHLTPVEIEVDTLAQLEEALAAGARIVLLDNMDPATLREAVALTAGRATLEASGGVTLERVREIAETGVDVISSSRLTMGARPLDIGLDIRLEAP
ncbi:MAG: carboxylating nicotinate-nucleotide diphosphorylase [Pseudomonadota bacterium]